MSVKLEIKENSKTGTEEEAKQSTRVSNNDLYRRSTQYRLWSFTSSQLEDLCISVNKKGIEATKARINGLKNEDILLDPEMNIKDFIKEFEQGFGYEDDKSTTNSNPQFTFVTEKEERKIVIACADIANRYAKLFKLPAQVRATAITYLMRFFLMHSVMEYNPQYIMYTCLFLAAKVESHFIGINTFSKAIKKTTPESILQYEYLILETMRFTLLCHHPYQPLYGFYLDIQNILPKIDLARLGNVYDSARSTVGKSLLANVQFLYTPPQIALACLWDASNAITERYLAKKFGLKRKKMATADSTTTAGVKSEYSNSLTPVVENENENDLEGEAEGDDAKNNDTNAEEAEAIKSATEGLTPASANSEANGPRKITPQERYDKMMQVIKECHSKIIQDSLIDSEATKPITNKIRYCLNPEKFYSKAAKQMGKSTAVPTTNVSVEPPTPVEQLSPAAHSEAQKRNGEDGEESEAKRIKLE